MGYRIYSKEQTKLAYDGTPEVKVPGRDGKPETHPDAPLRGLPDGHPEGLRSVLSFGVNEITANEYALLAQDVNFQRHIKEGFLHFLDDDGRAIAPPEVPDYVAPVVAPEPEPAEQPDAPPPAEPPSTVSKEVEDFFGLTADEQAAMYPALHPDAKALVDADPRSKPKVAG